MAVLTLADEIRALKLTGHSPMPVFDSTWNAALDRAAALAEAHESALDRMLAEARKKGMREAARIAIMTGPAQDMTDDELTDWGKTRRGMAMDVANAILAAAEKEDGK